VEKKYGRKKVLLMAHLQAAADGILFPAQCTRQQQQYSSPIERIDYEWDKALSENTAKILLALYGAEGMIESRSSLTYWEEMRPFFEFSKPWPLANPRCASTIEPAT
jgi:hypothetical protein